MPAPPRSGASSSFAFCGSFSPTIRSSRPDAASRAPATISLRTRRVLDVSRDDAVRDGFNYAACSGLRRQVISFCTHQSFSIDHGHAVRHDASDWLNKARSDDCGSQSRGGVRDLGFPAALRRELDLAVRQPAARNGKHAQFRGPRRMYRRRHAAWLREDAPGNAATHGAERAHGAGAQIPRACIDFIKRCFGRDCVRARGCG